MRDFTTNEQVTIYVETLFGLARDSFKQGKLEAFEFIAERLHGLVPKSAFDGFISGLEPNHGTNVRARVERKPRKNDGGDAVTNPVPNKPLSPITGMSF